MLIQPSYVGVVSALLRASVTIVVNVSDGTISRIAFVLGFDELKADVESGAIDTVVVAFTDMQGRLMGKRYTGHFFLESGINEAHTCDYLLAIDMEIEPVPGYKASSGSAAMATSR